MNQHPQSWTSALSKSAWTLLVAAIVVFVAWQLLKQLVVPLVVFLALVGVIRLALGAFRRDSW
jgi:CHASE2 domain-containing sensor protein